MSVPLSLNLSDREIERAGALLTDFLRSYEQSIPAPSVLPALNRDVLSDLFLEPFPEIGIGVDRVFRAITEKIVPNSTAIAHPRFLAYVLGPPNGIAPFADAIAAALNQNCNFWQLSPAASVIERKVIGWLAGLFEYPSTAGGLLTSGGSIATLVALATAIQAKYPGDFRRKGLQGIQAPLVVYTSEEAHRCVDKDAVILGVGLENVRKIPVDADFRMRLDGLAAAVHDDRLAGKQPCCVVAAAGTINTGAIDPIDALADFCAAEDLWLHVDGAFGALFVLSPRLHAQLRPCGRADSIALDPHKLLFAPLEAGCLLVRDRARLRQAFQFSAAYLTAASDPLFTNFMDYGPQLSRSFKALKVWCALQAFGVRAFVAAVEHMLDLARYLEDRLRAEPSWELLAPVTLNAVCFRLRNADEARSQEILAQLVDEGTALLGPVRIGDRFGLRACITNYRTQREDIDRIVGRLRDLGS
ncbi:MAG TPA: pyridoxal-dependent decarboxylase [Candidatus Methylomirabilis sp.]|nr:pyridoxal-dependent decarboxylase [Candidatus Methylomirabilis sp.]